MGLWQVEQDFSFYFCQSFAIFDYFSKFHSAYMTQRAKKFKIVLAKKLVKSNESKNVFREIAFLAVLNFFQVQKLIFGHF